MIGRNPQEGRWVLIGGYGEIGARNWGFDASRIETAKWLREARKHIGERVLLTGGGSFGKSWTATLERVSIGKLGGRNVPKVKLAGIDPPWSVAPGRPNTFEPWLGSWQISAWKGKPMRRNPESRTYYLGYYYDGNQLVGQLSDDLDGMSPEIVIDPPLIEFEAGSHGEAVLRARAELRPGADLEIDTIVKYKYVPHRTLASRANPRSGKPYARKMDDRVESDEYLELADINEEAAVEADIPGLLESNIGFLIKKELGAGSKPSVVVHDWELLGKDEHSSADTILGTYSVTFSDESRYDGNFVADGTSYKGGFVLNGLYAGSRKLKYFG